MSNNQKLIEMLALAGVTVGGKNPWDVQILDNRLERRIFTGGSLAVGDSFVDKWWTANNLDQFIYTLANSELTNNVMGTGVWFSDLLSRVMNLQSVRRAFQIAKKHYDINDDVYRSMLDSSMAYTCGYWKDAENLEEAQRAKADLVCLKLGLGPGMRLLDIGCGWGGFAEYAAREYGVKVVGVTVSVEQAKVARERVQGLPVDIRVQDYRSILNEKFDRITTIGMIEHVGYKNYRTFFETVRRLLNSDGLFLLHTIGSPDSRTRGEPWVNEYIFRNGMLPSLQQLSGAAEKLCIIEDVHNFGADYDRTLMAWWNNFNDHWDEIRVRYDERFYRMWQYYLLSFAGMFRSRNLQLWQIVFSPSGVPGGYTSIR